MSTQRIPFFFYFFTVNVVDVRRQLLKLNEQSQWRGGEKLTKRQCQALYPDGNDSTLFFEIEEKLGSLNKAETLLVLCNYDFTLAHSIAEEAALLFHCNMKLLKSLYKKFNKNVDKVLDFLRKFKESNSQNTITTHCYKLLNEISPLDRTIILKKFDGDAETAKTFVTFFENEPERAEKFMNKFDDANNAYSFVEKFHGDGDKASFFLKRFSSVQTVMSFLEKFDFGTDASTYLDKFSTIKKGVNFLERFDNNGNNAAIYLKKFNSPYEAIACMGNFPETNKFVEFAREFSNSFDSALHFSNMFNSYQEAYEHLCTMRRKCDEKLIIFAGEVASGFLIMRQRRCS